MIAAKLEEILCPKVQEFSETTRNGYTALEIIQMEKHLLTSLEWFTCPPTLSMWGNWYMT